MEEHERFDEEAATMPLGREQTGLDPVAGQPRQPHYRTRGNYGRGPMQAGETRPFLLTSEFAGVLLAIIAVAITAAVMPNLGARLAWIVIAGLVVGYTVSRGLAKAGTASNAVDPRERLFDGDRDGEPAGGTTDGYGPWGALGDYVGRLGTGRPTETRPFFETSEFAGAALAIIAVAITAAVMSNVNARLAWILIAALVVTYAVSRGLAKAGTASYSFDPRERLLGDGSTAGEGVRPSSGRAGETRPFLLTSEFVGAVLAIVAVAISAAALDSLNAPLAWIVITAITCGYVLSRGIAKIGNTSHAADPREHLLDRVQREEPATR
jgi:cobalamin synthase